MAAEAGIAAGIIILVVVLWLVIMAAAVFSFIFWIWMIVDQRDMKGDNKVVWILLLVFLGILGAIIYYFVIKRKSGR